MKLLLITILWASAANSFASEEHPVQTREFRLVYEIPGLSTRESQSVFERHEGLRTFWLDLQKTETLQHSTGTQLFYSIDPHQRGRSKKINSLTSIVVTFKPGTVFANQRLFDRDEASVCGKFIENFYLLESLYKLTLKHKKNIKIPGTFKKDCRTFSAHFQGVPAQKLKALLSPNGQ